MRYTPLQRAFVDPNLAQFYSGLGQQSLENFQKFQDQQTATAQMRAQAESDRAEKMWGTIGNVPGQVIEGYQKVDKAKRDRALSEEQLAASRQSRAEQAAMAPVALETAKAGSKTAQTEAAKQARMEEAETAIVQAKDAYPGEQKFAYRERKAQDLQNLQAEAQRLEMRLANSRDEREKRQLAANLEQNRASIAATNASIGATQASTALTKTQGELATTELAATKKSQKVAEMTARLLAPQDAIEVTRIIKTMEAEGATPGEVGLAIQGMKSAKVNQQLVENAINAASPAYQATIRAQNDAETYSRTATSLVQNLKAFKDAPTLGDADKGPMEAIVQTLRSQGKNAEADRLGKYIEVMSGMDQATRSQRATQIIGSFIDELASDLAARPGAAQNDPILKKAMASLSQARQGVAGINMPQNRNPFGGGLTPTPGTTAPVPVLPAGVTPRSTRKVGKLQ
jgi:hypothetical protein